MTVYGYTKEDANFILRQARQQDGDPYAVQSRDVLSKASGVWLMQASGAITAASGATPGTGTAILQWRNPTSGNIENIVGNSGGDVSETVYSVSTSVANGDRFLATRDNFGSIWVVTVLPTMVRFTLDSALATSDASKAATVDDSQSSLDGDSITVYNPETATASTYIFAGDSGDAGLAMKREDGDFWIVQMECP